MSIEIGTSGRAAASAAITGTTRVSLLGRGDARVTGPARRAADVEEVGAVRDHPPRLGDAPPRPGPAPVVPASSPSPENESGVTLSMPIT